MSEYRIPLGANWATTGKHTTADEVHRAFDGIDPVLANILNAYNDLHRLTNQDERLRAHIHLFDAVKALADTIDLGTHWHPCTIDHNTRPAGQRNDIYAQPNNCFAVAEYCLHHKRHISRCQP